MTRWLVLGIVALAVVLSTGTTRASAPPVGPLPAGPMTGIQVQRGELFAIVVPRPAAGFTWRGARPSDARIARPLDEAEVNGNIVFVYRAGRIGTTTVVYALTRGEGYKAFKARYYEVTVRSVLQHADRAGTPEARAAQ